MAEGYSVDFVRLIRLMTTELRFSDSTPHHREAWRLISHPRPGDLVIETSSWRPEGFGRLIVTREEFVAYTEEPGGYRDTFTYLETPDGRLERWSNCEFLRVLETHLWTIQREGDVDRTEWVVAARKRHGLD